MRKNLYTHKGVNNLKKLIFRSLVIICTILFLFSTVSFATDDINFKDQIKKEEGSLFEKIIAECIGGIAQTVLDFTTGETFNVGFKDYDTLIFNDNLENDSLSPFTSELWSKTMQWYKIFALISGSLILIAVFILSYKVMFAGMNTLRRNEAKESMIRLIFGGLAIAFAPMFIRLLLFLNNSLVHLLVTVSHGSLDGLLGNSMLSSIRTGNAITTAIVIAMFIYIFIKVNIKFIVRQFTIIIFTIFTPVAAGLWIINRNVTAASIWAGQIIMNIFMQFIYCFLFLVYLAFLPEGGGWAISLIWAMMILPLADALQNTLQNLTSRIAGVDNEQVTGRAMGMGAMLGYGIGTIKEQFKTHSQNVKNVNTNSNNKSETGLKGLVTRAKSVVIPSMNMSAETDYNGNANPIRNVIQKSSSISNAEATTIKNKENGLKENSNTQKSVLGKVAKTGYNATKAYLEVGAKMAEGNFNEYSYKKPRVSQYQNKNKLQNTEYVTQRPFDNKVKNIGDKNETDG